MLNFEPLEVREVKMATFLEITPQTVTLCLRELQIILSRKSVHKKRKDSLHGMGYSFSSKLKMQPCKDDLFERNYQNNQLL